ncbi:MAG TPA: hypothetical protein VGE60_04460 [Telluria sp.]
MTSFTQPYRLAAAFCAALVLAACGGDSGGDLYLAGSISGLTKEGLVLENRANGDTKAVPAFAQSFVFDKGLDNDETFDVQIKTQPNGAVCTPFYNRGRTGAYSIQSIEIRCQTNAYQLGGSISGLSADGLVLINGADKLTVPAGATSFIMPTKVADGGPYGLIIFSQPAGQQCAMAGTTTGLMGSGDNLNAVQITCQ